MSTKQIKIQVYSDIHIELMKDIPPILPTAKYLFLVGDICNLNNKLFFKFFDYCSPLWEKIFFTPGNHEFYSGKKNYNVLDFEYDLKLNEKYKNVYYLNRKCVSLNDDIDVYGCVFWTIPQYLSTSTSIYMNDYREIKQFSKSKCYNIPIDSSFMNNLAEEDFKSISKHLNNTTKKLIILTHFPPTQTGTINPVYKTTDLKNYYN